MHLQNIRSLAAVLTRLGFSAGMESQLLYYICLRQKEFVIREQQQYGTDIISYVLFFKRKETGDNWVCSHYDASLRKEIRVTSSVLNPVEIEKAEEQMRAPDWKQLGQLDSGTPIEWEDKKTWEEPMRAQKAIDALEALSATAEGGEIAEVLKFKYWVDLPLEKLIPHLPVLKSRLELSQRFYVLGEEGITAAEAYRFLNNQWIQRQMQIDKKREMAGNEPGRQMPKAEPAAKKHKRKAK